MIKIIVDNGDWDKACAELGRVMEAKKNSFNAQFEAAFGPPSKPAVVAGTAGTKPDVKPGAAPAGTRPGVILSRPRSR
jgi:hypothetical protein